MAQPTRITLSPAQQQELARLTRMQAHHAARRAAKGQAPETPARPGVRARDRVQGRLDQALERVRQAHGLPKQQRLVFDPTTGELLLDDPAA